jgi:polyphosphate kinase 2 (PPK2 family)
MGEDGTEAVKTKDPQESLIADFGKRFEEFQAKVEIDHDSLINRLSATQTELAKLRADFKDHKREVSRLFEGVLSEVNSTVTRMQGQLDVFRGQLKALDIPKMAEEVEKYKQVMLDNKNKVTLNFAEWGARVSSVQREQQQLLEREGLILSRLTKIEQILNKEGN